MNNLLKTFLHHKFTFILLAVVLLVVGGSYVVYQKVMAKPQAELPIEEIDLTFDPEGPFAVLAPRRDGKALVLDIRRTSSYEQIKYELVYNSEGIDRGASGEINVDQKKAAYEQEILFGTCSSGGKCVYDLGVENGTLTLFVRKANQVFRIVTQWHMQQPEIALGKLTSGDNHFIYQIDPKSSDLELLKYTVINELSGAPKLSAEKSFIGKVYSLSSLNGKDIPEGAITIEMAENPPAGSKIASFKESENKWTEFETKIEGSTLTARASGGNIFAVLSSVSK